MCFHLFVSVLLFIVFAVSAISPTYGETTNSCGKINLQNATKFSVVNLEGDRIYPKSCLIFSFEKAEPIDITRVKIRVKGTPRSLRAILIILYFNKNVIKFNDPVLTVENDRSFTYTIM